MINIKDLILIILIICVIYLFYKTNKIPENFSTISNDVKTAVNDQYKVDMDAIRNLASFSRTLYENENTFTLPATTTIARDLIVNGAITFTNKDNSNSILEIFPKYMVIAWASERIPNGWAKCDNNWYKLVNGMTMESLGPRVDANAIKTPDLRGRFVLGAGVGGSDNKGSLLSNRVFNTEGTTGGEEKHILTDTEMATHSHHQYSNRDWGNRVPLGNNYPAYATHSGDNGSYVIMAASEDNGNAVGPNIGLTSWSGNNQPHENMPPFYVLYYIMKL
jgi:microcystin-dependent protein